MLKKYFIFLPFLCFCANPNPEPPQSKTFSSVDFLFWSAGIDGTELGVGGRRINALELDRNWLEMNGKWEPGVRAALGRRFGSFDEWEFSAVWTYYHGRGNKSDSVNYDSLWIRQGWSYILGPAMLAAKGHWNFNFNIADLKLARAFCATNHLKITPYIAARGAFSSLNLQASYAAIFEVQNEEQDFLDFFTNTHFAGDSKYLAGGICSGTSLSWSFGGGWALFGDFNISLLGGQFDVEENFKGFDQKVDDEGNPILSPVKLVYTDNKARVRTAIDFLFGFQWNQTCRSTNLSFFAGYEFYEWFALNQLFTVSRALESYPTGDYTVYAPNFAFTPKNGDVGLQGLTARFAVEF